MEQNGVAFLWCLVAAALFGAATPAAKALVGATGPLRLAGLLYLGAALAVMPFAWRGGSATLRREPKNLGRLGIAVLVGGGLAPVFLLTALARAPAASVALWLNLEVVATAVVAWALFRENLGGRMWLALATLTLAGILLAQPHGAGTTPAALLIGTACLCWAVDNNLASVIDGFTPAQYTLAKGLIAGTVNLALGSFWEPPIRDWRMVVAAVVVGALGYGVSIVLYVSSSHELGASRSQMVFATAPFVGGILSWIALREPVQEIQLVSATMMAIGIAIMFSARHGHEHTHQGIMHTHSHRHDDAHHDHAHPGQPIWLRHTHPHTHEPLTHTHSHMPDLHHRHRH